MLIEDWPLERIRPYPNNPRVMRNAAEKVAESIRAFGPRQPIVVDEEGVVIIGHTRLAAAKLLKLSAFPVHVAVGLSADQVRALRIADNKTGEFAGWDDARLHDELAEIMAGLGNVSVTGFSASEFDALEMRARADLARLDAQIALAAPAAAVPAPAADLEHDDEADEDQGDDETADAADAPPTTQAPDLVPFNVLLTVQARQVVFDAIAKAKASAALQTTADALHAICLEYTDA
jgi:ParB-like chromosome segregation protein Spo0J